MKSKVLSRDYLLGRYGKGVQIEAGDVVDLIESHEVQRAERRIMAKEILALREQLENYRKSTQFCETHQPKGGTRAQCLLCTIIQFNATISRIDYMLGEPNEMEVSDYDLHCDTEAVVNRLRNKLS